MLNWISRFWRTSVIGSFFAGLLFLLPIVLTVFIVAWIVGFVRGAIGPGTILGDVLTRGGSFLLGLSNQDTLAFWLGVGIALIGIWLLGLIVKTGAKHIIQDYLDRLLTRLPFIRSIYNPVSRVVRLATERGNGAQGDLSSMSVVSCRFGGEERGVDVLSLLASQHVYNIAGQRRRLVYVPTTPIPMSGGLVLGGRIGRDAGAGDEGGRSFKNIRLAGRVDARSHAGRYSRSPAPENTARKEGASSAAPAFERVPGE